jgi:hypothetical protein
MLTYRGVAKLIHDDSDAVTMSLSQYSSKGLLVYVNDAWHIMYYLSRVDFPAPKKPQIIVRGTRLVPSWVLSSSTLADKRKQMSLTTKSRESHTAHRHLNPYVRRSQEVRVREMWLCNNSCLLRLNPGVLTHLHIFSLDSLLILSLLSSVYHHAGPSHRGRVAQHNTRPGRC